MALRQREVTGIVVDGDGLPIENGTINFKPTSPLGYTTTHIVVDREFQAQTDETGAFSTTLWCDEDSLVTINYNVTFPIINNGPPDSQHIASFSLQYGDGTPVNLATVINASIPAPTPEDLLYTLIEQLIAAAGGGPPSGGADGVLSGDYPNPGFAVDMVEQTELTTALALKANVNNAALTGVPTAPTAAPGTNTTQLATTAFVIAVRDALLNAAPGALDTLDELAAALGDDANFATTITTLLAAKASLTGAETLTNKRITPRVGSTASSATPTPDADAHDVYKVTALATNATFGAPSGIPTDGQPLIIRVKDNGTARTLAFNAIYRAIGVTLPTTTVIGKTLVLGMMYNSDATKWDVIGVALEA